MTIEWKPSAFVGMHAEADGVTLVCWPHLPGCWRWIVVGVNTFVESTGRMLGGTEREPPALLLPLLETIAATLAAAREAHQRTQEQQAPSAPEEVPCSEV
jgi:hypothetical protein